MERVRIEKRREGKRNEGPGPSFTCASIIGWTEKEQEAAKEAERSRESDQRKSGRMWCLERQDKRVFQEGK